MYRLQLKSEVCVVPVEKSHIQLEMVPILGTKYLALVGNQITSVGAETFPTEPQASVRGCKINLFLAGLISTKSAIYYISKDQNSLVS